MASQDDATWSIPEATDLEESADQLSALSFLRRKKVWMLDIFAEMLGYPMEKPFAEQSMDLIPLPLADGDGCRRQL